ncbi:ATPase [Rhodohalobacter sp. SW132]|uniref:restriction endonuclease n=1 Tax=Rhodohalobacter sp. SW132 TaxID=2293433 RepID=UPI000E254210|nr:restriction endonuclease [Rhodohalobacter sp. SW132]REL39028.1 ATPase [Rhodohalobacter sp. SW132]
MPQIHVTKASGEQELFDESKLRKSLKGAGASDDLIDMITKSVSNHLFEGISTRKIYREAFRQLRAESQRVAGRYKLKEAILELGPTGFPFECFVAEILNRIGYKTEVGVKVQGDCVTHEIDVIAIKDDHYYMVECKFHNKKENSCNVQVPLYIQSRFLDVKNNWTRQPGHAGKKHTGYVVTNTRFTQDALDYGKCIGLNLLSWDYPKDNGLKDVIGRLNLHPITCLSTLTKTDKEQLTEKGIVLTVQLYENKNALKEIGIDQRKANRVIKEARAICKSHSNNS